MKIKKCVGKILIIGTLINNLSILSNAGVLSQDTRYETFEENNITIPDILEKSRVELEIEGDTLVNLASNYFNQEPYIRNPDGTVRITKLDTSSHGDPNLNKVETLKRDTEYTLFLNKKLRVLIGDNHINGSKMVNVYNSDDLVDKVTFKTSSNTDTYTFIKIFSGLTEEASTYPINGIRILLLEGDWSDKEVPGYFEGVKSVGQNNEYGHGVEISAQNKNLLPNAEGWVNGQIMVGGHVNATTIHRLISIYTKEYIKLKKGQYTFSYPNNYEVAYHVWDRNLNYVKDSRWIADDTFILNEDCYIKVTVRLKGSYTQSVEFAESMQTNPTDVGGKLTIQLEKGVSGTDYKERLLDKTEIILNEPLRGLPNGVKDRIIKKMVSGL